MYRKNLVFAAACLGMLLFGIVFLSLGSVNNMLAERFKLDDQAIGTLTALLPFGILAGSLIFGSIVDHFGYRWLLVISSLIVGGALEGIAATSSRPLVQFCVFAIGFGGGMLNGATNALAADISEGERGAKLSLLGVFFGIGALLMPSTLAALSHNFQTSTIVAAIGMLVLIPVVYCLLIEFPPPKMQSALLTPFVGFALLRDPFFLAACLAMAIQSGMEGMSNDWMTRYFKMVIIPPATFTERSAQLSLVSLTAAMVATRFVLAGLLKWIASPIALAASICLTAIGAIVLLQTYAGALTPAIVGVALIGSGLAAIFPVVLGYVGDRYPSLSGTAFSTIFVVALLGNMAINKTFGLIAQHHGVAQYPKMLLGLLACSAVLLFFVVKRIGSAFPRNTS
jgi:FHS family glucose/mannose:H+ symporter-like MFS transporter